MATGNQAALILRASSQTDTNASPARRNLSHFPSSNLNMTRAEKFSQWYREADWIAHLVLMTCCAASLNFLEIFRQTMTAAAAAGTHVVDGYEITVCYFGPPASFYPRLYSIAWFVDCFGRYFGANGLVQVHLCCRANGVIGHVRLLVALFLPRIPEF